MDRFKDMEDLDNYIDENCGTVSAEPEQCYICGNYLVDSSLYSSYYVCDEYAPDDKFCSTDCIKEFLINKIGFEEEE